MPTGNRPGIEEKRGTHHRRERLMTGLSVLYAKEAAEEREWAVIPDRDRTGRLREVYWARRAELKSGRKSFASVNLKCRADRTEIGRRRDDPGDGFIYLVEMTPRVEDRFEWLEVTEVFTTVPALRIEGAMRAWNGIADKQSVDFDEFRKGLRRGRPSRMEQRRAADQVIAQIERKLAKTSYHELLERYGYGTLVVGMPLWFAVPPDDPFRAENAVDDFMTRTTLGLEDVRQRALRRRDCPFRNVIVIWDTTPQALREWRKRRCAEYDDAANTSLENPMPASFWGVLSGALEKAVSKNGDPGEGGAVDVPPDRREDTKKGVGHGALPETRRGSWGGLARTRRESRRTDGNVEVESHSDAVQAALFRESSRSGRVGTMDRAKVFGVARLEGEGDTAKGAVVLPRKQTKRLGVRWAAQS